MNDNSMLSIPHAKSNKLNSLSNEIKDYMNFLILEGYGSSIIKRKVESKYGACSDIFPASRPTYNDYIKANKARLIAENQNSTTPVNYEHLKELTNSVLGLKGGSKQEQIANIKEYIKERLTFLEHQQMNRTSAQTENNIDSYVKTLALLIEQESTLEAEMDKDLVSIGSEFFLIVIRKLAAVMNTIYKKYHGEDKFLEFSNDIKEASSQVLKDCFVDIKRMKQQDNGTQTSNIEQPPSV